MKVDMTAAFHKKVYIYLGRSVLANSADQDQEISILSIFWFKLLILCVSDLHHIPFRRISALLIHTDSAPFQVKIMVATIWFSDFQNFHNNLLFQDLPSPVSGQCI